MLEMPVLLHLEGWFLKIQIRVEVGRQSWSSLCGGNISSISHSSFSIFISHFCPSKRLKDTQFYASILNHHKRLFTNVSLEKFEKRTPGKQFQLTKCLDRKMYEKGTGRNESIKGMLLMWITLLKRSSNDISPPFREFNHLLGSPPPKLSIRPWLSSFRTPYLSLCTSLSTVEMKQKSSICHSL